MIQYNSNDILIDDGFISVKGIGRVGLWWKWFDKKVCIDWSFGESFFANTEEEVKYGILKILNSKKTKP